MRTRLSWPGDGAARQALRRRIGVWGTLPLGLATVALGAAMNAHGKDADRLLWFGGFIVVLGMVLIAHHVYERRRVAELPPDTPAFERDHDWPAREDRSRAASDWLSRRPPVLAILAAAAALLAFAFLPSAGMQIWGAVLAAAFLTTLGVAGIRMATAPTMRLTYAARPYLPDAPISVRVGLGEAGSAVEAMDVTLRCIKEWGQLPGGRRGVVESNTTRQTLWEETIRLPEEGAVPEPGADVDLTFDPPHDLPETSLSADLPAYWELHVTTRSGRTKLDYEFLIPVYDPES